jgi:hypothetical protein
MTRDQLPLFPKKRKPSKGGPAQPESSGGHKQQRRAYEAERARADRHGLYGAALPEDELAELAEGTPEDELAEERIRATLAEDLQRLRGKKGRSPEEEAHLREVERLSENDEEIARLARVRCDYCGADPRAPEFTGMEIDGGRDLAYTGCCLAGSEAFATWINDAPTEARIRWAKALFGPYVEHYGEIAYVTGPMGEVERRRRGEWEPTEEEAGPFQLSYGLQARVVRDEAARELVGKIVGEHHAHMAWEAGSAWKFGVIVHNGPDLVGVAWIQNPGSRMFPQDGSWLDVARVAIRRDLPPFLRGNAASLIYSTAWRAGRDGTWVSDDEWLGQVDPNDPEKRLARYGIQYKSDQKRARAEAAARAALALHGTPSAEQVEVWGAALDVAKPRTWARVKPKAAFVAANPWRVKRRAIRMITYTLADEEQGTTLKAAGWEPASWSAPHAAPSGARRGREERAGKAPKIQWQIGLPEHARPIVALERQLAREDRVSVGPSRGGVRAAGHGVTTLALRVYGIEPGPDGAIRHQNAITWGETAEERAALPKGVRRQLNPLRRRKPGVAVEDDLRETLLRAAGWLSKDDPGLVAGGCGEVSTILQELARRLGQGARVRVVSGIAWWSGHSFPHAWNEVDGVILDATSDVQRLKIEAHVEGPQGRVVLAGPCVEDPQILNDRVDVVLAALRMRPVVPPLAEEPQRTNPLRRLRPDPSAPPGDEPEPESLNLRGAISACGTRPKAVDFHVVEGRAPATLILDVSNVVHYGPELFWENRCPLLAGFREGKVTVTRPGVSFPREPVYAKSFDLEALARRVGLPLARVERLLVLEGRAWAKSGRA